MSLTTNPFRSFRTMKTTLQFFLDYRGKLMEESQKHHALNQIIDNHLIHTYYQPIINLKDHSIFGYESLNRPETLGVFRTTEQFYDFVGSSPNIFELETLCRKLAIQGFYKGKRTDNGQTMLFINVHPRVMTDPAFKPGQTLAILNMLGLKPEQVVFEVTEKGAVQNYSEFISVVNHYKEQGFRIAVDDAGSGYNSLKTLVFLQPEFIKIDQTIINGISENRVQQEMVQLLVDYANRVDTKVIAEGIETWSDFNYLQQSGVHFGQGYLISRPSQTLTDQLFVTETEK